MAANCWREFLLLAFFCLAKVSCYTAPEELEKLERFRDAMLAQPKHKAWAKGLATWKCPTEEDGSCDPCGSEAWGKWEHMACRDTANPGTVTTIHFTDLGVEGTVPLEELCAFDNLWEFDLDGGQLEGTIPTGFAECFPLLKEIDLSYNQLTGTIPGEAIAAISSLEELKLKDNNLQGSIPEELCDMPRLKWLRVSENLNLAGTLPQCLRDTAGTLQKLELDHTAITGRLGVLSGHTFEAVTVNNTELCGPVPASVRFAPGFDRTNTRLGRSCLDDAVDPSAEGSADGN